MIKVPVQSKCKPHFQLEPWPGLVTGHVLPRELTDARREAFEAGEPVCLLLGGDYCWLSSTRPGASNNIICSSFIGFPLFSNYVLPW